MEAGVSQKLPDCVKRTQRLAHNQYNQRKKDLLYTSPKHQHLHAVKVYAMSDRAGMVVPSDEDTWEGEKSARGWGVRMGLLLSHFLLPLTPNHALTQYSLKSLYTFLKVEKKNQGGGSDKMAVPLLFKNNPGFSHHVSPHAFSQLSVTLVTMMPREMETMFAAATQEMRHCMRGAEGNLSTAFTLCNSLFVRFFKYPGTAWEGNTCPSAC